MTQTPRPSMRERFREQVREQILDSAEAQISQLGAAGLSLRAIARENGMAPSAIHRYFTNRDDVVTALMVREFGALGDAIDAAETAVAPRTDYSARIRAVFLAQREWALSKPHSWFLLFGSLVPDYTEPHEVCDAGNRFVFTMVRIVADMAAAGLTGAQPPTAVDVPAQALVHVADLDAVPNWQVATGFAAYSWMCGAITAELRGMYADFVADNKAIYDAGIDHWLAAFGLE